MGSPGNGAGVGGPLGNRRCVYACGDAMNFLVQTELSEEVYEAVKLRSPDADGFERPYFTREEAERLVGDHALLVIAKGDPALDILYWDDEAIIVTTLESEFEATVITPTPAGLYYFGVLGWAWTEVEQDAEVGEEA